MQGQFLLGVATFITGISVSRADKDARIITSTGCVAPTAFDSCLSDASQAETQCVAELVGSDQVVDCGIILLIDQMQCYFESCWDKIYSCEFQFLVNEYQAERALTAPEDVPFWPAPDNAPGGCSCNLGALYSNATESISETYVCDGRVDAADVAALRECTCCAEIAALGAYYGICPTTDPDQTDLSSYIGLVADYDIAMGGTCTSVLNSTDCAADWGIYSAWGGTLPDPAVQLPPNGTQSLQTTGIPLTTPPGGQTFTWSLLGAVRTVTAAPYNSKNAEETSNMDTAVSSTSLGDTAATGTLSGGDTSVTPTSSGGISATTPSSGHSTAVSKTSSGSAATTSAVNSSSAPIVRSFEQLHFVVFALLAFGVANARI